MLLSKDIGVLGKAYETPYLNNYRVHGAEKGANGVEQIQFSLIISG